MPAGPLPFDIRPSAGTPIYRQIVDQAESLISAGRLSPGELLPSVRDVARVAAVNPMTVSKAYSLLEANGWVERVRGRGMRVLAREGARKDGTLSIDQRKERFRNVIEPAIREAKRLGLTPDQVRRVIDLLLKNLEP